jgi:hypothetical protein
VFISNVDAALEQLVRDRLSLTEDVGEVSFATPDKEWAAKQTRITVNVFLYDVQRSADPSRSVTRPDDAEARRFRRPQPMIQLSYLISTWAGGPRDEHQLLSDLVSLLAGTEIVPATITPPGLSSTIRLSLGDDRHAAREIWQALGGTLRPAVQVRATVAADTFAWEDQAPAVERIAAMADRIRR